MKITKITEDDFEEWLVLALKLWSDSDIEELRSSLTQILHSPREASFLMRTDAGKAIAFLDLSLRYEYVPGATQSPVAYVEGIYVEDAYRQQGIGKALIKFAEQWAFKQGCVQLASDALLENIDSYEFHTKMGFQEVERVVTFIKAIDTSSNS